MTDKEKKKRRRVFNIPCWCCAHKVRALGFVIAGTFLIPPSAPQPWLQQQQDTDSGTASIITRQDSGPLLTKQTPISKLQAANTPLAAQKPTLRGSQMQTGSTESLREAAIATTHNQVISGCLKIPNTAAPT